MNERMMRDLASRILALRGDRFDDEACRLARAVLVFFDPEYYTKRFDRIDYKIDHEPGYQRPTPVYKGAKRNE